MQHSSLPPSAERKLSCLDTVWSDHYSKALAALAYGKLDYVIALGSQWIRTHPDVAEFRKLLRQAQIAKHYPGGCFNRALSFHPGRWLALILISTRDTDQALLQCEQIFSRDPLNIRANEILAEHARRINWHLTHKFALQTLLTHPKRRPHHVKALVELLIQLGEYEQASKVCTVFLKAFANHPDLLSLKKQATIAHSMESVKLT